MRKVGGGIEIFGGKRKLSSTVTEVRKENIGKF